MTSRGLGLASVFAVLMQFALAAPAQAWWGKLERLSGAGPFGGEIYEFRVACFGDRSRAAELTREAVSLRMRARAGESTEAGRRLWREAGVKWVEAGQAWAELLGETFDRTPPTLAPDDRDVRGFARKVEEIEPEVGSLERRGRSVLMATSSAGVFWSLCGAEKERRVAIDVGWSTLDAKGEPDYAGGAPINFDTLTASVSWRLLAGTKADFFDVGAGGGVYWFTSTGFPSLSGVILQPVRVTFRAPAAWSGKPIKDWRRWAAVPVYAAGITMFPAGFEPNDFAGVGDKAVRLPRELLFTQYFFVNVEPFLQLLRK